jgi:hypothetical protein
MEITDILLYTHTYISIRIGKKLEVIILKAAGKDLWERRNTVKQA